MTSFMKKNDYLSKKEVISFVEWLSLNLCNEAFAHSYINRRTGQRWSCTGLFDAYKKYDWPTRPTPLIQAHSNVTAGSDFSTNATVLAALQDLLTTGLNADDLHGVTEATVDVMTWGGVRAGNVSWLRNLANQKLLLQTLKSTRTALNAGDITDHVLTDKSLRFNAGMTKVYSLICDDFIIYDSRVGAAIGWIVSKYCQSKGLTSVPTELRFPWAPAKEAKGNTNPKRRDPGTQALKFPRLQPGPLHAEWNLKASWLLEAVLKHPNTIMNSCFKEASGKLQLRALEAALFMIGYDLGMDASRTIKTQTLSTGETDSAKTVDSDNWNECFTIAKSVSFQYKIHSDHIATRKQVNGSWVDGPIFTVQCIDATLAELLKQNLSNDEGFPLDAEATNKYRTSDPGLGTAYVKACTRSGSRPHASRLAAILEELGVLVPVRQDQRHNRRWMIAEGVVTVEDQLKKIMEEDDSL